MRIFYSKVVLEEGNCFGEDDNDEEKEYSNSIHSDGLT